MRFIETRVPSSLSRDAHTSVCFLVVEVGMKRKSFNFAACFIMLLLSNYQVTIRSTILERKRYNSYNSYKYLGILEIDTVNAFHFVPMRLRKT